MDIQKQLDEAYTLATKKKEYDKAFAICNEVIKNHPSPPDGLRKRAAIYAHKGELALAISDMTKAIEQDGEPTDYFFRGWWHLDAGDAVKAVKDLTKTLELGEQTGNHYHDQSAHFFRAAALLRLQRYDEALADCEHVQDDFMIFIKSGKISKADIVKEAKAGKSK